MRAKSTPKMSMYLSKVRELHNTMKLFCLNPSKDTFTAICSCEAVKRKDEESFQIWKQACIHKYGELWESPLVDSGSKFERLRDTIVDRAVKSPSQTGAIKIIHLFYATGELGYIDLFYQMMGDISLAYSTRIALAQIFKDTRDDYRSEIDRLIRLNPTHFDEIGVSLRDVDFDYFDKAKERAIEENRARGETNKLIVPKKIN